MILGEFKESRLVDKFTMENQDIEIWIIEGELQIRMPNIGKIHNINFSSDLAIVEMGGSEETTENVFSILSKVNIDEDTKWLFSLILTYLFNLSADESKLTKRVERLEIWTGR